MPISAGLREDIAVCRGFIGQQYFQKITLPCVHQKMHKDYPREVAFILPYIGRTRYYPKHNKGSIQHL